jgi:adenylate cyclase
MSAEIKKEIELEIAHLLFIDIVGYSKLSINDQRAAIDELTQAVRGSERFQSAEAAGRLIKIPTGDGMALVFYKSPEEPVECALEISRALKEHPRVQLRMGVHSGPVSGVIDVNGQANLAGAGLNMAQRVMHCGDAGHILLSRHVAEDLEGYEQWRALLHDLGFCEVKHGVKLQVVNLCADEAGNRALPAKVRAQRQRVARTRWILMATSLVLLAVVVAAFVAVSRRAARSSSAVPEKSIAVLPLVDLSETKDQEYLCDGFSEELLDSLAKVPGLRVVARTSAFSFKGKNVPVAEIANKLGVANIIEGSLRRDGNRIRVTTQLISARDGFHLWSDTFQRELRDVFAVQDEITHAIVDALKMRLVGATSVRTGTENAEAYDLYLQGLYFSNKSVEQDLRKSLTLFQQALDKDPNFSRAWTGIAKAWLYLADAYVKPLEAYPVVVSAAGNALQLNERDPEAHCFLGVAKRVLEWDPERMLKETQRALEIDPNSSLGHVWLGDTLRDRGEFDRALHEYQKAVRLDPLSPVVSDALCYGYVNAGRLDDAITQGKHTLELDPNYVYLDSNLANAYRERGLLDQAIVFYRAGEQSTHSPSAGLAISYARLGKIKEAEQKLAELLAEKERRYISASNIALVYAALGKKDEAFAWLERAYSEHDGVISVIAIDPGTQPLRGDPRFINLVKRVGMDPAKAIPREVQH